MKKPKFIAKPIVILTLLASLAVAQEIEIVEEAEVRRYTVEIIIFSYAQDVGTGTEIFVAEKNDPDMLFTDVPEPTPDLPEPITSVLPTVVEPLAREDFSMRDIYDRIRRLDVYKPLMHFGWTQQMLPEDETMPRPLSSFATPPRGLEGDLTLYLSRFMHLEVDLKLESPGTSWTVGNDEFSEPLRYHLSEDGIIKNGELRYFDHPKFGVLAKVVRVEEQEEPDDPLYEPELLGSD